MSKIELPGLAKAIALLLPLCAWDAGAAAQINWRSLFGGPNYTSDGAPEEFDASYIFELGAFTEGFNPAVEDPADWAENWTMLDRTAYNASTHFFTSAVLLQNNNAPFTTTNKGWIWGFSPSGEWILLRASTWNWPNAGGGGPGGPGGITWKVQDATEVVMGAVGGTGDSFHMMSADAGPDPAPYVSPEAWRIAHFTDTELLDETVSGWNADPDHDGCSNAVELAMGSDPRDGTSKDVPERVVVSDGGIDYQALSIDHPPYVDLVRDVQVSDDLVNWKSGLPDLVVVEDTATTLIVRSATPLGSHCEFLRMIVTIPDPPAF